jgi:hypothetical protein
MTYECGSGKGCSVDWVIERAPMFQMKTWVCKPPARYLIAHNKVWDSVPRARARAGLVKAYSPTNRPPKLVCLCKSCWAGLDLAAGSPAQTVQDTIYFNTTSKEYAGADRELVVKSIACHEWHHYLSHGHTGFQAFSTTESINWDEVVTDYLGRLVFKTLFPGAIYKTFYNPNFENFPKIMAAHIKAELGGFKRIGGPSYEKYKTENALKLNQMKPFLEKCGIAFEEKKEEDTPSVSIGIAPPPLDDLGSFKSKTVVADALTVKVNARDLAGMMVQSYFNDPKVFDRFRKYLFTNEGFYLQSPSDLSTK